MFGAIRQTLTRQPRAYQRIHLCFQITVAGVQRAQLERAVDLALNKYCSVRVSLEPEIAVTFAVELRVRNVTG